MTHRPPNKLLRATGPKTARIMVAEHPEFGRLERRFTQGYSLRDDIEHERLLGVRPLYAVFVRPK